MVRLRRPLVAAFYVGLGLLVLLILTDTLGSVLGDTLATQVARSSEGFVAALLLAPWLQLVLPRLPQPPADRWRIVGAASVTALVAGVLLFVLDPPTRFRTLNETFLALALLLPWTALPRPVAPVLRWAPAVVGVVAVGVGVLTSHPLVVTFAEAEVLLVVATIGLEVVDRGILDPDATTSPVLRWGWYALLAVAVPLTFLMSYPEGEPETLARYLSRGCEAYICMLLVQALLAVVLGRTGRGDDVAVPERAAAG